MDYDKGRHSNMQIILFILCLGDLIKGNENNVKKKLSIWALRNAEKIPKWKGPPQNVKKNPSVPNGAMIST